MGKRCTGIACAALAGWLLGCGAGPTFVCASNTQCGVGGTCEANGGCSFPDAECESGRRFAEFTPSASLCVPVPGGEGSSSSASSSSTTSMGSASDTLEPDGTTVGDSGSTSSEPVTTTSTTTEAGSTSSSSSSSESSTGEAPSPDFFDDFERLDSDDVGNGWVEKTPESFALIDGGIRRVGSTGSYQNNLVYRPTGDWLDAEAIVELTWLNLEGGFGSPQFVLRAQLDDIDVPGSVTGYLLFVNGPIGELTITRQIGGSFTQQHIASIKTPVQVGTSYRLRLRVTGTDPVVLDGYLEQIIAGAWTVQTEVHGIDDTPERISNSGTFAVGGHVRTEYWVYEAAALEDLGD